ncbi:Peptidase S24/S26A/S26B/S26C family protein [Prunus dulcis]|uniref:Peptidase S24/S26A/S26B/S26C family protein n=1 Tax=Prunus dulcis TaxID=3755 RepID=A0A4Y1RBL0_PRUDU|nr:Peptidase S24/S26A/S26B/S26C family protein [Prunus dulcis]
MGSSSYYPLLAGLRCAPVRTRVPSLWEGGAGDLVLVRSPNDPRKIVTKRILGMEGDQVTFFVDPKHSDRSQTTVVPKGHVWIQGITSIPPLIHEHMELYLMVLFKAKCFAGCGHLMALDHWIDEDKEDYNIKG